MKAIKNLALWCENHAFVWPWEEGKHPESTMHLIAIWVCFIATIIVGAVNHYCETPRLVELYFQCLAGIVSFFPPIYAAIKALVTKTKWEPWFWFNWVVAAIVGCILAIIVVLVLGWYKF